MDNIWYYILIIGVPISVIGAYFTFGEYIVRFFKWIFRKEKYERKICVKIIEWFSFIDGNLTEKGIDLKGLDLIEKEIDFLFNMEKNSKLMLRFSNKFIDKYLRFCGLKKKCRSKEIFLKYAHIKHNNLELILGLESHIQKRKITQLKMPFNTYWGIFRGNFHIFHQQYINGWNGITEDQKVIFSDIEMPIKLLRMYFRIY